MSVTHLVSMRGALFLIFYWLGYMREAIKKMTCSLTFKSCDKNYRHWSMRTRRVDGINDHRCQYSKDNHPHSKTDNLKRKRTCDEKLHQLCTSRTFAIIVLRGNVQISSRTVSMTSGYPRLCCVWWRGWDWFSFLCYCWQACVWASRQRKKQSLIRSYVHDS